MKSRFRIFPTIFSIFPKATRAGLVGLLLCVGLPAVALVGTVATAPPASADSCYTWDRKLRSGSSGSDVTQLQVRVAGWAGYGVSFPIDGSYGPKTVTAVKNFQRAYGLSADGVAGPKTFSKIYALQDGDCSPKHFAWSEVDDVCYGGWPKPANGVSVATVKSNLKKVMWRAEALRHRLGDHPLRVTSAYRSKACNDRVGGASNSFHLSGKAMDLVPADGGTSLCGIIKAARYTSFGELFGPGYPDHGDHIHVAMQNYRQWSASRCGI